VQQTRRTRQMRRIHNTPTCLLTGLRGSYREVVEDFPRELPYLSRSCCTKLLATGMTCIKLSTVLLTRRKGIEIAPHLNLDPRYNNSPPGAAAKNNRLWTNYYAAPQRIVP
jgi:hypothetical protein